MIAKHGSKSTKKNPHELPLREKALLRNIESRFPDVAEEEASDHYWGTSDSYFETYFDIHDQE